METIENEFDFLLDICESDLVTLSDEELELLATNQNIDE